MPRTETVETFTLDEMRELHPDGYARILKDWQEDCRTDDIMAWSDETMASLKATVKAYGATLDDWQIGPYCYSSLSVTVNDDETGRECADFDNCEGCPDCEDRPKDADWALREVLVPLGYHKDGKADFPGLCPFTGYCADDDFMEATYRALEDGSSLSDALRSLADKAREMMENDEEDRASEESMVANWDGEMFRANGERWY